ncbi:hypothetical protein B6N60_00456 [Richelia sinica FACHB-800]|uniref:Uncharacterized protein n=1 Tax=Richelia sinica FACHB-800 TaxID=1357546 RepID=A0A975Y351_9NOST|nr:hypothetical protein [Richelia sinica]MBD2662936.1 hypothetical protein [Richelia sinica FACHB-800]QXE21778.1 hypothetical protein B6N60_00456 [Richelia sinica FACHB-800]
MRDDLQGLEITPQELQEITNLPVNAELIIITRNLQKLGKSLLRKIRGSEGATVIFISLSVCLFTYLIFDVFVRILAIPINNSGFLFILFILWLAGLSQAVLYFWWKRQSKLLKVNMTNSLQILLNDVKRFNSVIKAIDINDQIEAAGNLDVKIQKRERVIEALQLTKADLIRALKTERIMRENKNFILNNSELFANNLATLASLQVTEQATEHGRLLNEALQIALDVQYEMKRLQSQG